jgi:hypothetical protein
VLGDAMTAQQEPKVGFPRDTVPRVLLKLSTVYQYIPSKLLVSGVTLTFHEPLFAGGFADIFKGTHEDKHVALKRFRDFLPGHSPAALDKVCSASLFIT